MKVEKVKDYREYTIKKIKDFKKKPEVKEDIIEDPGIQYESGFYRDDSGGLLLVDRNGKSVSLDFQVDNFQELLSKAEKPSY